MKMLPSRILHKVLKKSGLSFHAQRKITIWLELITLLVGRDLKVRYRGSFFGYLWSMANPLFYMVILSFVFSHVMKFQIDNFPLFILSGILTWNLFQQSLSIGVNSIIANGALLKKVQVPSAIFPAASVASVFVNFCLSMVPFFLLSLYFTGSISWTIVLLPFILIPYVIFIYGCVLALSALNVSFRDIGHVLEPVMQALFYATPIVYPATVLPDKVKDLVNLNPMTHFVRAFRQIMFDQASPSLSLYALLYTLSVVSILIGVSVFRKRRHRFIYEL